MAQSKGSPPPYFDLDKEYALQQQIKNLIPNGLVESAHDCSDGGLYIALLESAMPNELGFYIITDSEFRKDAYLFGEAQSRVVVSVKAENQEAFVELISASDVDYTLLGEVTENGSLTIDGEDFGLVKEKKAIYDNALAESVNAGALATY